MSGTTTPGETIAAPVAAPATITRHCRNCERPFEVMINAKGAPRRFCDDACRKTLGNRAVSQGVPIVPLLMAWRLARNSKARKELGAKAFAELVLLADSLIDEEREEGRSSATILDYAEELIADGSVVDRCRRRERKRIAARGEVRKRCQPIAADNL